MLEAIHQNHLRTQELKAIIIKMEEKRIKRQERNIKDNWKWKVYGKEHSYNISTPQKIIADKLNEVLDYLKSKGDE